jgi:hypothetical protein
VKRRRMKKINKIVLKKEQEQVKEFAIAVKTKTKKKYIV